jgi:hypothetical protein
VIRAVVRRAPCENGINPDYNLRGAVVKPARSVSFAYDCWHNRRDQERSPFHEALFAAADTPEEEPTHELLREHLKRILPDYMVPSLFVSLETLPISVNGKVDRSALPDPGRRRPQMQRRSVAPRSPIEAALAEIWMAVLGLDAVGVEDDFLHLGGESLLATQVISRVGQVFGVEVPLRSFFESPTISALAHMILRKLAAGRDDIENILDELENSVA